MTNNDNLPSCDDILQLPPDAIAQLVRDLSQRRQLSLMVKSLNAKLLEGEAEVRSRAHAVLTRLGFIDN